MTIKDFRDLCKREDIYNFLAGATDIWSNDACKGYVIATLKSMGVSGEQISTVVKELESSFSDLTVDEAAKVYQNCKF